MKNFAFIFARKGSKRVKNKNIKKINGKPLVLYSIEIANKIKEISKVFVSTNDKRIKKIALKNGCIVIDRPEILAKDKSAEWLAWQHAINFVREKYNKNFNFISIPPTSPLRNTADVKKCIKALDQKDDIVITLRKTDLDPNFNMIMKKGEKIITFKNSKNIKNSKNKYNLRNNLYDIYSITTVAYISRPNFILSHKNFFEGKVKGVVIPESRALDIDSEFDFALAEAIIKKKLLLKDK